jgi:predicted neutral ceramidase superfamily lipid hydrolase
MPDPSSTTTIPAILTKRAQSRLASLVAGTLATSSDAPADEAEVDELVDAAGNALTLFMANTTSGREYAQAQETYTLAKVTQHALRLITHEPGPLNDLAEREAASMIQAQAVGSLAMAVAAGRIADPNGAAALFNGA